MDIDLQETKKHNIQAASRASSDNKISSETGKIFKTQADLFPMHLDTKSLT